MELELVRDGVARAFPRFSPRSLRLSEASAKSLSKELSTSIKLDDGKVEELNSGHDRGAGVRVARGTSYGYAYANRLDRTSLLEAAEAASAALRGEPPGSVVDLTSREGSGTNRTDRPAADVPAATKVGWLRGVDARVRRDPLADPLRLRELDRALLVRDRPPELLPRTDGRARTLP